jgi:hypothetical protein
MSHHMGPLTVGAQHPRLHTPVAVAARVVFTLLPFALGILLITEAEGALSILFGCGFLLLAAAMLRKLIRESTIARRVAAEQSARMPE